MLYSSETKIPLSSIIKRDIKAYAKGWDIYRMNTGGVRYYCFTPYRNETGKVDFTGGWDWLNTAVDTPFSHVYDIETGRFYTADVFKRKFSIV